jgi:hypothetical protein
MTSRTSAILYACVIATIACNRDSTGSTMSNSPSDRLVLVVDTDRPIEMGYGYEWHATIKRVVEGTLPDTEVWISVHGADVYGGHFQCCAPEQGVEVALRRIPKRPTALVGFAAKDGTIWEIVDVKR